MLQHTYVPDFQGVFNLPGFLQEKISMSIRKTMQLSSRSKRKYSLLMGYHHLGYNVNFVYQFLLVFNRNFFNRNYMNRQTRNVHAWEEK